MVHTAEDANEKKAQTENLRGPSFWSGLGNEYNFKLLGFDNYPFRSKLSFAPFIRYVEDRLDTDDAGAALLAKEIMGQVKKNPELREPIEDISLLRQYKAFMDLLMAMIFPAALIKKQLVSASKPFDLNAFYQSPELRKLTRQESVKIDLNIPPDYSKALSVTRACVMILNKFYGQEIRLEFPFIFSVQKPDSNLQMQFKSDLNIDFVDIKKIKPLKPLTQRQINKLLANIFDLRLWLEHIPPDRFEFHGMVRTYLIDITEEETISRLKFKLLEKDALVTKENIKLLEQHLRNYFRQPRLCLGITSIDYPAEKAVAHAYKIRHNFLADKHPVLLAPDNRGSVYEKVCRYNDTLLIEDLTLVSDPTAIEVDLVNEGIRSLIVAPLVTGKGRIIGLLELGSQKPNDFNSFSLLKLTDIIPLFCISLERFREEIENQIQAVIQEQFTAIHPSVLWKFSKTAYNLMNRREREGCKALPDPILLQDVYPLYAQADIVSSSTIRNDAIQSDFLENLEKIKRILEQSKDILSLPICDKYLFDVSRLMQDLKAGINSSDESRIIAFIKKDLHGVLQHIAGLDTGMAVAVNRYMDSLDEEFGILYKKRKAFEDSVTIINDSISQYIEQENEKAQQILPHYFEKYQTDGVEFDMYVGQALLPTGTFNDIHLKNLRLWQLITLCEVTRLIDGLKGQLQMPLTTAQLIFVYSSPLSIRFRMDEKRFDVDGAYNVRYEILKKRIDKAYLEGTKERLTQPGKIAIVYTSEKDRVEYSEYLEYLLHKGYLDKDIEYLNIGQLQGVQGLKAIRVTVQIADTV